MAKFTPKRLLRSLAHLIKNATPRPIDMLEHCGRRGFATSMGLDGDIILGSEAAKKKRRKSGLWSYLRAGWDAFHSHDHYSAEITVGDETERLDNLITVGVTKLQFFGYGLRVCPNAVNDDGNLYVKVVRGEKYRNVLSAALSSLRTDGNKVGQDFSGKKVKVRTSRPVNLQMDGDYTETSDLFEFKVLPGAARVLY